MTPGELHRLLIDPVAELHLRTYFGTVSGGRRYTGKLFDTLAGLGGGPAPNRITPADLIAVQMLSVVVDRDVAFDLLNGDLGNDLESHLVAIDPTITIANPGARALLDGPATAAWNLLEGQAGVGWVTAGKLLARKRPLLIPVYDTVIRCVAHPSHNEAWQWFDEMFAADNSALMRQLEKLRAKAEVDERIPPLRVLDVVIWMRHKDEHSPSRCRGLAL